MDIKNVYGMFFSATGTTEKIVKCIASGISEIITPGRDAVNISFTLPDEREEKHSFGPEDLVVIGTPTYAGRVPNVLLPYLKSNLAFNGSICIPVVLYGNRDFDDSLIELRNIVTSEGAKAAAAAAFVGEHSFSYVLAKGRPDEHDMSIAEDFAVRTADKIRSLESKDILDIDVKGQDPVRPYYTPRDRNGNGIDIRKVKPVTGPECDRCGICASVCPMGSIAADEPADITGICIKCGACVKKCPKKCKFFTDENYLYHRHELEDMYSGRKEPELFI